MPVPPVAYRRHGTIENLGVRDEPLDAHVRRALQHRAVVGVRVWSAPERTIGKRLDRADQVHVDPHIGAFVLDGQSRTPRTRPT